MEVDKISKAICYQTEITKDILNHRIIPVENLSPILSAQERQKRKQEINKSLYEVFKKYQDEQI